MGVSATSMRVLDLIVVVVFYFCCVWWRVWWVWVGEVCSWCLRGVVCSGVDRVVYCLLVLLAGLVALSARWGYMPTIPGSIHQHITSYRGLVAISIPCFIRMAHGSLKVDVTNIRFSRCRV